MGEHTQARGPKSGAAGVCFPFPQVIHYAHTPTLRAVAVLLTYIESMNHTSRISLSRSLALPDPTRHPSVSPPLVRAISTPKILSGGRQSPRVAVAFGSTSASDKGWRDRPRENPGLLKKRASSAVRRKEGGFVNQQIQRRARHGEKYYWEGTLGCRLEMP